MRILKMEIRLLAILSLVCLIVTGEVVAAISLLAFSSISLAILIEEKSDGGRKKDNRSK